MSTTPATLTPEPTGDRRVRHQARDAAALMVFSLVVSVACAAGFLLLAQLGR